MRERLRVDSVTLIDTGMDFRAGEVYLVGLGRKQTISGISLEQAYKIMRNYIGKTVTVIYDGRDPRCVTAIIELPGEELMGRDHPDLHKGFALRMTVVQRKEVWKNKEDSHGGPGYYSSEEPIATFYRELSEGQEVSRTITKVARGEM